jgi:hypothetical protein
MRFRDTLWVIVFAMSCQSTGPKAPEVSPKVESETLLEAHREPSGAESSVVPTGPLVIEPSTEPSVGQPPRLMPIRIVLAPAKAQGFAYMGALEALRSKGIRIKNITATGFPGLLASLFAFSKSANQLEWQLTKLPPDSWETKSWVSQQTSLQVPTSWQKHLAIFLKDKHPSLAPIPVILPLKNGMDAGVCDLARNLSLFTGDLVRPPCPELAWQEVQMESQLEALIRTSDATGRGEPLLIIKTSGRDTPKKTSPYMMTIGLGIEEEDSWDASRFQSRMSFQYRGRNALTSHLSTIESLVLETP